MAVLLFTKEVIMGGGRWFSAGQGIVAKIIEEDGTFLSVTDANGGDMTLPCDCVALCISPQELENPPASFCLGCGKKHPEKAVWESPPGSGRYRCNECYAKVGGDFIRWERDPETRKWVRTAPLSASECADWDEEGEE